MTASSETRGALLADGVDAAGADGVDVVFELDSVPLAQAISPHATTDTMASRNIPSHSHGWP